MAIKINWQILYKRINRWKEVEKIMCNWTQIRPELLPTHYSYIIDGYFTRSSDWRTTTNTVTRDSNGFSTETSWAIYYQPLNLLGASKIEIWYEFYWNGLWLGAWGDIIGSSIYNESEGVSEREWIVQPPYWENYFHSNEMMRDWIAFESSPSWRYSIKTTLDLVNGRAVKVLTFPNGVTKLTLNEALDSQRIENIKKCNAFSVWITKRVQLRRATISVRVDTDIPYVYAGRDFVLYPTGDGGYQVSWKVRSNGTISVDIPSWNYIHVTINHLSGDEYEFYFFVTSWRAWRTERVVFISDQDPSVTDYLDITFPASS